MTESAQTPYSHLIQPGPLALLGGRGVLCIPLQSRGRTASHERRVLTFQVKFNAVEHLGKFLGWSVPQLMQLIQVNERTAQRRKEQGALSPEESDRIARIARITLRAIDAFGDESQAREWLKRPNRVLDNVRPLELLGTDAGAALVADELGHIEYGDLY